VFFIFEVFCLMGLGCLGESVKVKLVGVDGGEWKLVRLMPELIGEVYFFLSNHFEGVAD
jgi:hypothetical protein